MNGIMNDFLDDLYKRAPKKIDNNRIVVDSDEKAFSYSDILAIIMRCAERNGE